MKNFRLSFFSILLFLFYGINLQAQTTCDPLYVSSSGTSLGDGTTGNPLDLITALNQVCSTARKEIRLLHGTYNLSQKITIGCNNLIIDGSWEVVGGVGVKNTSLSSIININSPLETSPYDGVAGTLVGYYIGIEAIAKDNFKLTGLTINVKNGGSSGTAFGTTGNRGNSVYGLYFSNSNSWTLENAEVNTGAGSQGANGLNGVNGANGIAGEQGGEGNCNNDCLNGTTQRYGGKGGNGGGSTSGGARKSHTGSCTSIGQSGNQGFSSSNPRNGGGGGSGATGGSENRNGGIGGNGGGNGVTSNGATSGGGWGNGNGTNGAGNCAIVNGKNGGNGGSGSNGTNGAVAGVSNIMNLFWLPSGQSGNGTYGTGGGGGKGGGGGGGQGCFFCSDGTGSSGGGGGGGGQGGAGGTGGWGGGGSFSVYLNASSGSKISSNFSSTLSANGGAGGIGGTGGAGGLGGNGGSIFNFASCSTCEVGTGGAGGIGGTGGTGGNGANGANGLNQNIALLNSSSLDTVNSSATSPSNISKIISCGPYTWIDGITYTSSNNTATHILPNAAGCDSIVTLDLTIFDLAEQNFTSTNPTLCDSGSTDIILDSSQVGVNYYLRNDTDNSIIDGPYFGTRDSITFNTGTINSSTTYNIYAEYKNSAALQFTGNVGVRRVSLGTSLWNDEFAGTSNLTVESWVKRSTAGNLQTIISNYPTITITPYEFLFRIDNNKITFFLNSSQIAQSTSNIPVGTWTHLAATYDGATVKIYVNGVLEVTSLFTGNLNSAPYDLKIGGGLTDNTEYFSGDIGEVRLWNVARTENEIASSYQSQLSGNENGLIAYYKFNEGSGTTTYNSAANGMYDGTLVNSPAWVGGPAITSPNCDVEFSQKPTITIGNSTTATDVIVACDSVTWIDGLTYTSSNNTAIHTLPNAAGCDSLVTLDLTINNTTVNTTTLTIQGSYTWAVNGQTYTSSGTFTEVSTTTCHIEELILTIDSTVGWTGVQDNNWNNPGNWSTGVVPSTGADVIITTGLTNYPELEVNAEINNLEVASGASFTIRTNQTLTVTGTLTNNGTITVESGGALVQGSTSTLAGTGNYIVQRDFAAGQRFLGSPINNKAVNNLNGFAASGSNGAQIIPLADCNPNSVANNSPYGNILEMRENAVPLVNCAQSLWFVKSAGNFDNARGYAFNASAAVNLDFIGTINNGVVTYSGLGRQTGNLDQWNGTQTRGWHLVSNPYPSPIRISNGDLGAGWDNSVHFFDGNDFVTVQLNLTDAVVPVGQGFQIRKSAEGGSINFSINNSMREGGNPAFYAPTQINQEHVNITLSNNQYQSRTTVYFQDGATAEFDAEFDAIKLFGATYLPQVYTVEESPLAEKLSYNALTPLYIENQQSVVLGVYDASPGSFALTFDGVNTVSGDVVLEDKKLETFTNLSENFTYNFTTSFGDDWNRFVLHFNADVTFNASSELMGEVKIFPNPSNDVSTLLLPENHSYTNIQLLDMAGRTIKNFDVKNDNNTILLDAKSLKSGVYFIQLMSGEKKEVLKWMVK